MLSFLTDTCEQLAEGAAHEACNWAASNPAIALGAATATLLATTATGLYFCNRKPAAQVPVARMARRSIADTIRDTTIDPSKLVVPVAPVVPAVPEMSLEQKMNVNLIVLKELNRQLQHPQTAEAARQLLTLRQTQGKQIDSFILRSLGLDENGQKQQDTKKSNVKPC